ncbi:hypothetical protein ACE5IS_16850 [Leptospira wolffii]|uniref:Uncharacterized protein n=1 Tax=Leptospira wolffii TaxID=409998 RepID=A0ABV5BUI9_9LEPT|nr:hypothetical protein [Leptospira wolffii]TGL50498.1 hypothetical protein EHQ61_08730 [Leptospira wolffii]
MILSIVRNVPEEAYIISESTKLDDRFLNLDEALSEVIGFGASTIVSVIPGELAYYEGEDLGERFLLLKID